MPRMKNFFSCLSILGICVEIHAQSLPVGMPVLALWGPTRPEIWRPPHPHVRLLSASGGLENLAVNQVETALRELLG